MPEAGGGRKDPPLDPGGGGPCSHLRLSLRPPDCERTNFHRVKPPRSREGAAAALRPQRGSHRLIVIVVDLPDKPFQTKTTFQCALDSRIEFGRQVSFFFFSQIREPSHAFTTIELKACKTRQNGGLRIQHRGTHTLLVNLHKPRKTPLP